MERTIYNVDGSIISVVHADDTGAFILEEISTNLTPLLENNARLRAENDGWNEEHWLRRSGSYDPVMLQRYLHDRGIKLRDFTRWPSEDRFKLIDDWMNSRDYRKLKTVESTPKNGRYFDFGGML